MRLVTFTLGERDTVGALQGGSEIVPLAEIATDMLALISLGEEGMEKAQELVARAGQSYALEDVKLRAPIPHPRRNIMCLGKNYAAHAEESQRAWGEELEIPQYPVIFTKATTAVIGPFDEIRYDPNISRMLDFEVELAVIIGRGGRDIGREEALDYVYGYAVMNDITARDLQRRHKQFFKGKSLDGSTPLGPWIVTRDEVADPQSLQITCAVNGQLKQDSNTKHMIFDIAATIAHLSRGMTLLAGDIIATGTPGGVGFARTPPEYLQRGDVVTSTVEQIGTIRNRVGG